MTSRVVGRFRVDRVVAEHPFYVAETSQVLDKQPEDEEGAKALLEAETRVWNLLKELDALSAKTGEGGGKQIDYDMQRCAPEPEARPPWDSDPPAPEKRAEMFSWAVVRRLGLDTNGHLDCVRSQYTTARLAAAETPLKEGLAYLAAVAALQGADEGGEGGGDDEAGEKQGDEGV